MNPRMRLENKRLMDWEPRKFQTPSAPDGFPIDILQEATCLCTGNGFQAELLELLTESWVNMES
ncbi:Arylsulfatase Jlike [Caligus rogercresseyi]|uniref:Arylsulfatase Jlike n=1 Tax=Caligus rogercresseyi TaxID=217165 RepID=A0A7T8KJJ7_CALRO|nr:Arylsulfatase Jlike [Caligus rogercresseyi]